MDDRCGAGLLHGLVAGATVDTLGVAPTTPHAAVLLLRRVAAAAVRAAHRAVIQRH